MFIYLLLGFRGQFLGPDDQETIGWCAIANLGLYLAVHIIFQLYGKVIDLCAVFRKVNHYCKVRKRGTMSEGKFKGPNVGTEEVKGFISTLEEHDLRAVFVKPDQWCLYRTLALLQYGNETWVK